MPTENSPLYCALGKKPLGLLPAMSNRHGLIAGATGTGKTISLHVLAENFSQLGVPVFLADVKGDLAGISQKGQDNPKIAERIQKLKLSNFSFTEYPTTFWDVFGEQGHPIRTTVSEMGPLLLSRILSLNEVQEGVLTMALKIADDQGLLVIDLKDLRSVLQYVGDNASSFTTKYGNISAASIGTIQRSLLTLESQGGEKLFGEPALNLQDFIQTDTQSRGVINILAADRLMQSPKLYATFLLWMLAELFETMPEVGDIEKPKLVFFFDEAHLLFEEAPKALLEKIEQVVRLIRSKGVGVYFISQNPLDIPETVLGQLGNRIQHALRAFTPKDQKAVKVAADTFRSNPDLDTEKVITELNVGEALVSFLDEKGAPGIVERAWIYPPHSQIGAIPLETRKKVISGSVLFGHYEKQLDRESAFEKISAAQQQAAASAPAPSTTPQRAAGRQPDTLIESMAKNAARAAASQLGRQIIRGVLGSILGGGRTRRY